MDIIDCRAGSVLVMVWPLDLPRTWAAAAVPMRSAERVWRSEVTNVEARPFEINLNTPSREVRLAGILVGFIAARAVLNAVYALLDEEDGAVDIDMAEVLTIDEDVVGIVARLWEEQHRDGYPLAVVNAPAAIKRAFVAAGRAALLG